MNINVSSTTSTHDTIYKSHAVLKTNLNVSVQCPEHFGTIHDFFIIIFIIIEYKFTLINKNLI